MKKYILSTVLVLTFAQPAFAWDWLDRQWEALPEMPRMSDLSGIYGMEREIEPKKMVIQQDPNAPRMPVQSDSVQFKPAGETLSGEERMVLFDDEMPQPITSDAVMQEQMMQQPVDDVVIRSSDYYQPQELMMDPPAVIRVVDGKQQQFNDEPVPQFPKKGQRLDENPIQVRAHKTFKHCQGFGCRVETDVEFSHEEWGLALRAFNTVPIENPKQERMAIAIYIGEMEKIVGAKTKSTSDVGGTFTGFAKGGQLDCQDEATNTGTYLGLLAEDGLLTFHDVGKMAGRGFFTGSGGWPHQSATIIERGVGQVYAVDSWFENNGIMPYVLKIEQWKDGWSPEGMVEEQAVTSEPIE